ncbi:FAD-binding oxidoreductase [Pseudactinotalea sp. HY158]|uniref:NAD(P)/FAD-dependent oxidoreductase n=1 Tax=Pseudactinotalea sp. HY158 TaxID=2654547 RepID=UPI00129CE239|nr:FAD-dependent oxidoreductase [Pseudactinotalea sp. HY158]QGH70711.1 FAD-dependent oxidoreductase [Pseudactinotalea sp. HY158]
MAAHFTPPSSVGIIGAGVVGLATAWALQRRGISVTVIDRSGVAAGATQGNAGWVTPSMATPLPSPAVLRYGLRAVLKPTSPVFIPPTANPRTLHFLAAFARNCTSRRWRSGMRALAPINLAAVAAYDQLADSGVGFAARGSYLAGFRSDAERQALVSDLEQARTMGQDIELTLLDDDEAREREPALSSEIRAAAEVVGERFIDPGAFAHELAATIIDHGGRILRGTAVEHVVVDSPHRLVLTNGEDHSFDAVVIATGAWLDRLVRPFGVRVPIHGGRGYSFSVTGRRMPGQAVYLPEQRVVCTPLNGRARISGMMEIQNPDAPSSRRRIQAIIDSARSLLTGLDFDDRRDEWMGSRPCTADGLPVIGGLGPRGIYAHGGHGMWGVTQAPATASLLAEMIVTGRPSPQLSPFDPLR